MSSIAPWLAVGWILFVFLRFFVPPPALLSEIGLTSHPAALVELPLLATTLFGAWLVRTRRQARRGEAESGIGAPGLLGAFALLLGVALLYLLGRGSPLAEGVAWWRGALHLVGLVATVLCFLALQSAVAFAFGRRALRWLGIADDPSLFVPALGLGVVALANGAFALAGWGAFTLPGLLALFTLLAAVGAGEWRELARLARRPIRFAADPWSLPLWCGWAVFLWAVLAFASLLRATPVGWDDLTAYMNRAQELAVTGALVPGGAPYPVELLYGAGFVTGRGLGFPASPDTLALYVAWWGGLLGVLALVWLGRQARSWQVGWVAAAIYCTLPIVVHMVTADMKVDTTLFAFIALSLGSALRSRAERAKNAEGSQGRAWLLLAGVFLGFALSIKATALFAAFGLAAIALRDAVRGGAPRPPLSELGLAMLLAAALLAPWSALHVIEREARLEGLLDLATGLDPAATGPDTLRVRAGLEAGGGPAPSGLEEERGRYRGYELGWWCTREAEPGWLARRGELPVYCIERHLPARLAAVPLGRVLSLPWDVSLGRNVELFYASVGPLFLACLPAIGLLAWVRRRGDPDGPMPALALFGVVHLVAWAALSWGIPWYGIGMFAAFAVLIADFVLAQSGAVHGLACGLLAVGFGIGLLGQTERLPGLADLPYALGAKGREESIRARFPGMLEVVDAIESAPNGSGAEPLVLRVGTMLPYFLPRHRERLIDDTHLDQWNAVDGACGGDAACTLDAFHRAGVSHIVYDLSTSAIDATPLQTLRRKVLRFTSFADRSLERRFVDTTSRIALLEVPPGRRRGDAAAPHGRESEGAPAGRLGRPPRL